MMMVIGIKFYLLPLGGLLIQNMVKSTILPSRPTTYYYTFGWVRDIADYMAVVKRK